VCVYVNAPQILESRCGFEPVSHLFAQKMAPAARESVPDSILLTTWYRCSNF